MADSSDSGTGRAIDYALIIVALITFISIIASGIADGLSFGVLLGIGGTLLVTGVAAFRMWQRAREEPEQEES